VTQVSNKESGLTLHATFANSFTLIANTSDNVEEKEQRLCARYPVDGVAVIALINLIYNMNKNIQ
jgi:hypothetical protein